MALNLGALQNIRPLPDPLVRARSLADLRAMQQEEVTRGQEQQLNALSIEGKTAANQEWAKVRSIFDKHAGDKEGAISEILQTPWRSKEITDTYQGEADRMRKEAVSNASLRQGQPAPEVVAAAPQTATAPIQTSLTDPAQMSTPEVSPAATQAVPVPVQPTRIPFGGPTVQTQTAQQLIKAKRDELQAEADIKTRQAIAEKQAAIDAAAEEVQAKTVDTADGVFQWNPATKKYDIRVGSSKGKTQTLEEQTAAQWMKDNTGKTLNDYQTMDANRRRSTTTNIIQLTDAGLDAAALSFAKTSIMPSLGMGNADLRAKIINRSAELVPNLDIAANKADFKANEASLTQATKLKDALTSFENTALKNMVILEGSAKKVVDSGSPLLNKPLRAIDEKALGSTDLPVFRAARQIVVNEVAKLTNNPNLTGTLSDSARHEIESLLPPDMTLAQLLNLLPTLRQDMKNRTSSIDDQIAAIRGRISGTGTGPAKATHRYNPATGQIEEIK